MFKRKLQALDYMYWDKVNADDIQHFRKVVVWLEDQKIRHYTIQDRTDLKKINDDGWEKFFNKYLLDLGCPITTTNSDKLEWIIGLAVRLEYEDDLEKYTIKEEAHLKNKTVIPSLKSTNPLDILDFHSNEFESGVLAIAKLLKIPQHPNHLITLEACSKVVSQRLNIAAIKNPESVIIKGKPFPIMETSLCFDTNDKVFNNTGKALNLLYIQDLRNLQTKINEAIVAVQNITANPKTDTTAGRVGRL